MTTGILALQGDFREHEARLHQLGAPTRQVRTVQHLAGIERLIIPGGESTTIGKLLVQYGMLDAIRQRAHDGMPIWGTCAGAILLAQRITDGKPEQPTLGLIDMGVRRNAYGRQLDSFETTLHLPALGETPVHGIFIRAPKIESVGETVDVLGNLPAAGDETTSIIAAQQGRLLVTTFHPELTNDDRLHRYFLAV